jgi:uncharacterized membrane-anchored protein
MPPMKNRAGWVVAALLTIVPFAQGQPAAKEETDPAAVTASIKAFDKTLHYRTGDVAVSGNLATLHLGTAYRYLDAADAKRVLTDAWGNPPESASDVLGMITAADESPAEAHGWGVVVTHIDEGHIDDADAKKIDYDDMLTQLQKSAEAHNAQRTKSGFEAIHLIGWAQTPSYDESTKKLIWAKEFATDGDSEHSLNYDVRVLGREGVLSLNAVGSTSQLAQLEKVMVDVAKRAEFVSGQRYADYKPGTDRLAAYGVAGLIAGGVAMKAGLFKGILVALLALKKFVIIGIVALFAAIKKIFGGPKTAGATSTPPSSPPPPAA